MKLICIEEHFAKPEVLAAWRALDPRWQDVAMKQSDAVVAGAQGSRSGLRNGALLIGHHRPGGHSLPDVLRPRIRQPGDSEMDHQSGGSPRH